MIIRIDPFNSINVYNYYNNRYFTRSVHHYYSSMPVLFLNCFILPNNLLFSIKNSVLDKNLIVKLCSMLNSPIRMLCLLTYSSL